MSEYQRKVYFYFHVSTNGESPRMTYAEGKITCEGRDYVFVKFDERPNTNKAFKNMFPIKREQIIRRTA